MPLMDIAFACGPNHEVVIPDQRLRAASPGQGIPCDLHLAAGSTARFRERTISSPGPPGWTIADSLNFDAAKTLLFFGDTAQERSGPERPFRTFVPWAINDHYRAKGIDSRFVLVASPMSP